MHIIACSILIINMVKSGKMNCSRTIKILRNDCKELIIEIRELRRKMNSNFKDSVKEFFFNEYEIIDRDIQLLGSFVSPILNRGEAFLEQYEHDCNAVLDIKSFTFEFDSLKRSWTKLQDEWTDIFNVRKLSHEISLLCSSEEPWLVEKENELDKLQDRGQAVAFSFLHSLIKLHETHETAALFTSLKSIINETYAVSSEVDNHLMQFQLLETLFAELLSSNFVQLVVQINLSAVEEMLKRFESLKSMINILLHTLNKKLKIWEGFKNVNNQRESERVLKVCLPIQMFMIILLGIVLLFPVIEEFYCAINVDNIAWNWDPILRFPRGRPPT